MHFRRKMAPFMAGCLLLGSIRLPNLTVQASQAMGDASAYTEEAEAQQPVEDDSTVLGIVDRAAEPDVDAEGIDIGSADRTTGESCLETGNETEGQQNAGIGVEEGLEAGPDADAEGTGTGDGSKPAGEEGGTEAADQTGNQQAPGIGTEEEPEAGPDTDAEGTGTGDESRPAGEEGGTEPADQPGNQQAPGIGTEEGPEAEPDAEDAGTGFGGADSPSEGDDGSGMAYFAEEPQNDASNNKTYAAENLGAYGRWSNTPVELTDGKLVLTFSENWSGRQSRTGYYALKYMKTLMAEKTK